MIIHHDPDAYDVKSEFRVCGYHKLHPGKPYAGCTCNVMVWLEPRSGEEAAKRKYEHLLAEEDRILAEAERIKGRRARRALEDKEQ